MFQSDNGTIDGVFEALGLKSTYIGPFLNDPAGFQEFCCALASNKTIKNLCLNGKLYMPEEELACMNSFGEAIRCNSSLTLLKLSRVPFGFVEPILRGMAMNVAIEQFSLSFTTLMSDHMHLIRDMLIVNNHLTSLDVTCTQLTPGPLLSMLLDGVSKSKTLVELVLDRNDAFGDVGAQQVAQMLTRSSSLRHLSMSNCKIGVVGVESLCLALRGNTTLKTWSLWCNPMQRGGLQAMLELLNVNGTLRDVDVTYKRHASLKRVDIAFVLDCHLHEEECTEMCKKIDSMCARNGRMHLLANQSVEMLMACRRWRMSWLNAAPKDIVSMIGKYMWMTKGEIDAWSK